MNENIVDKRVYKTLTKIENGMIRLLEDKPYQHYTNKDDFLYQYQKEMIKKAQARIQTCLC